MVRLKHRYLLLNILYPTTPSAQPKSKPKPGPSSTTSTLTTTAVPSYLHFHAPSPTRLTQQLLLSHLRTQIKLLFGDHGLGACQSSLRILYFSQATSTAILRVPRGNYRLVWAALSFMEGLPETNIRRGRDRETQDEGKEVRFVIRVVRVSGTVRKAEEELIRRGRREVVRAKIDGEKLGVGGFKVIEEVGRVDELESGIMDVDVDEEGESE